MSPVLRLVVLLAGVLLGLFTALPLGDRLVQLPEPLACIVYVVAGTILWSRRPDDRTGPLLVAAGFAFGLSALWRGGDFLGPSEFGGIGLWTQGLGTVITIHALLGYPGGRIRRAFDKVLLGTAYVLVVGYQPWMVLTIGVENLGQAYAWSAGELWFVPLIVELVLPLVVAAVLVGRWYQGTPAYRRVMGPVLLVGVLPIPVFVAFQLVLSATQVVAFSVSQSTEDVIETIPRLLVPLILLAGMWQPRTSRGTVGDLVVDLARPAGPGTLRAALARTLRDPALEVAVYAPGSGWRQPSGAYAADPPIVPGRAVTIVEGADGPTAALIHNPALLDDRDDRELLEAAGEVANLAVENDRLHAQVLSQLEQVRASRARIVEAGDAERRRVERDLHDGAQQRLVMTALALQRARDALDDADDPAVARLDEAAAHLREALGELRELARGIHPAILTEAGLPAATRSLAERSPVGTHVIDPGVGRLPASVEATGYFVVSEALANIAKHAGASQVTVSLDSRPGTLRVQVSDDGVGGADPRAGSGLRGLEDRVAAVGGTLVVDSPPGAGTRVVAQIPTGPSGSRSSANGRLFDVPASADQAVSVVRPSPS